MSVAKKDYKRVTTNTLSEMKQNRDKISMLTAYDYTLAKIIDGDAIRGNDKKNSFEIKDIINNNERIINLCKNYQMDYDYLLAFI